MQLPNKYICVSSLPVYKLTTHNDLVISPQKFKVCSKFENQFHSPHYQIKRKQNHMTI